VLCKRRKGAKGKSNTCNNRARKHNRITAPLA
jgi:proteic killer suppression protein